MMQGIKSRACLNTMCCQYLQFHISHQLLRFPKATEQTLTHIQNAIETSYILSLWTAGQSSGPSGCAGTSPCLQAREDAAVSK
jgi:hypothetical protein